MSEEPRKSTGGGRKKGSGNRPDAPAQAIFAANAALPERPRAGRHTSGMLGASERARAAAEPYIEAAILELAKLAGLVLGADGKPDGAATTERVKVRALEAIIERAAGKPLQPIGGEDGGPLTVVIRKFTA